MTVCVFRAPRTPADNFFVRYAHRPFRDINYMISYFREKINRKMFVVYIRDRTRFTDRSIIIAK